MMINSLNKLPKRSFGIEIESIISKTRRHQTYSDILNALNLNSSWNIIEDKSIEITTTRNINISQSEMKCELISPILEYNESTMNKIELICNNLQYVINANINKSCGFHIHFDAEDLSINDIIKIAINYCYFEDIIDLFMDKTRRGNQNKYIQSIKEPITNNIDSLYEILESPQNNNYNKTNLSVLNMINPFRKCHKYNFVNLFYYHLCKIGMNKKTPYINTIENRHHNSTLNYYDMLYWIKFNLLFIHHSKNKTVFNIQNDNNSISTKLKILSDFIKNDEIIYFYDKKINKETI